MTKFQLTGDNNSESLVVVYDDGEDPVTVPDTHPKFEEIVTLWRSKEADDETVRDLVNVMYGLGQKLSKVTDRVTVTPYAVLFPFHPLMVYISGSVTERIWSSHLQVTL